MLWQKPASTMNSPNILFYVILLVLRINLPKYLWDLFGVNDRGCVRVNGGSEVMTFDLVHTDRQWSFPACLRSPSKLGQFCKKHLRHVKMHGERVSQRFCLVFPSDALSKGPRATNAFLKHTEEERERCADSKQARYSGRFGKGSQIEFESHDASLRLYFFLSNSFTFVCIQAINIIPHKQVVQEFFLE